MRRGWVQPILRVLPDSASATIFGSCVVFPEPVSLTTTTTGFSRIAATISRRMPTTGRLSG